MNSNCFHYSYNITGEYLFCPTAGWRVHVLLLTGVSQQTGAPASSVKKPCVDTASRPACWTVCAVMGNLWTPASARRSDHCLLLNLLTGSETDQLRLFDVSVQLGLDRKLQMNASCVVECPVNCQLSDWSAWSECTRSCGLAGTFFGMSLTWGNLQMTSALCYDILLSKQYF